MLIQRKGNKEKALSEVQERRNRRITSPRARVKHVLASLAQPGGRTLRSIGLAPATLHLNSKAATYNLRRFVYLKGLGIVAFWLQNSVRAVENGRSGLQNYHQANMILAVPPIIGRVTKRLGEITSNSRFP